MDKIRQIIDAGREARIPASAPKMDDVYTLAVSSDGCAWAVVACVYTESELRAAYATLRHLTDGVSVSAKRLHSYDDFNYTWKAEKIAL